MGKLGAVVDCNCLLGGCVGSGVGTGTGALLIRFGFDVVKTVGTGDGAEVLVKRPWGGAD